MKNPMSFKHVLLFILSAYCFQSFAQKEGSDLIVPFEYSKDGREYFFLYMMETNAYSVVHNIPENADKYKLYKIMTSFFSVNNDKFHTGKMSKESFIKYIQNIMGKEPSTLSEIELPQECFYVYVGIDSKKQEKYIIIDTDMDNDFKNDSLYTVSLDNYLNYDLQENPLDISTSIKITYYYGKMIQNHFVPITIYPFYSDKPEEKYATKEDYFLDIGLFANTTKEAKISIHNNTITVYASKPATTDFLPWELNSNTEFTFYDSNGRSIYNRGFLGDTVLITDRKFKLESVGSEKLILKDVGHFSESQSPLYVRALSDGGDINLRWITEGKYIFIDFWGSWCKPCIHSIPLITQFYEKYRNREDILIIGIVLEDPDNINDLRRIITEKQIFYDNYYVSMNEAKRTDRPHSVFHITGYPTYLILDKKGNIIYRTNNSKNTSEAISTFEKIIN